MIDIRELNVKTKIVSDTLCTPSRVNELDSASVAYASQSMYRERESKKKLRASAVEAITVTTAAGNTFDGDEMSQTRMARAIIALQATGTPTVTWVLADNSVIQASAVELSEALALAGAAQAAIWVLP